MESISCITIKIKVFRKQWVLTYESKISNSLLQTPLFCLSKEFVRRSLCMPMTIVSPPFSANQKQLVPPFRKALH